LLFFQFVSLFLHLLELGCKLAALKLDFINLINLPGNSFVEILIFLINLLDYSGVVVVNFAGHGFEFLFKCIIMMSKLIFLLLKCQDGLLQKLHLIVFELELLVLNFQLQVLFF